MMKIHTTQNLSSFGRMQSTNNEPIPSSEIRLNYSEHMRKSHYYDQQDTNKDSVSFKGKKEIIKKVIDKAKNTAGKEKKWYDKVLTSGVFDKLLDSMNQEVFIQAAISFLICTFLRPLAIMAIPTKKSKEDNIYASAHSISSGVVGLISPIFLAMPFTKGLKYAQTHLIERLKPETLKTMYPNLNIESIWNDKAANIRKPINEWTDKLGNPFSKEFKNVIKVAKPKHISEVSEGTLKSIGADINLAEMKGKSANEWVDRNGNKLHIDLKDMFIAVKEEGMGQNFFSLQHMDEGFLKEIFPTVDLNSIKKDGKRLHTDFWKNTDGTPFKLDMDSVHISSYRETTDAIPLYSGLKRTETKGNKETKYISYQTNNSIKDKSRVPDKLGSPVKQEYLDADTNNEIANKLLTWLPDIVTRPFVAASTIALIPVVLKNVFHLEKGKKTEQSNDMQKSTQLNTEKEDISARKAVA